MSSATFDAPGIVRGSEFFPRAEVLQRAGSAAAALAGLGVERDDAVAVLMRNDVQFFEAWAATATLGAAMVPINWHSRPEEVEYILDDCRARVVVGHLDLLERFASVLGGRTTVSVAGAPGHHLGWDEIVESTGGAPAVVEATAPSLMYSSGTTGRPKGIRRLPRSADQAAIYGQVARSVYGIRPGMRTLLTTPLYHSAPLYHATAAFLAGGTLVLQARFDAADLLAAVDRHRLTNLLMVPTQFVRLLQLSEAQRSGFSGTSLEHVVHGAAPCPVGVKRSMIEWWGPIFHEYYGCTESGIVTACDTAEWLAHPGTVGRPAIGGVVKVLGEDGAMMPAGTPGEIFLRNRGAADFEYRNLPEERRAVERDGLITCGDVGYLDTDGYLFLVDRKRDLVISGGVNIYPAEIEALIMAMPGVTDCAVFGIPDADYGERLAALVVLAGEAGADEAGIRAYLEARIGGLKVPKLVEIRAHLPRDPSGKILKRDLRASYWSEAGRLI